MTQNTSNPQNNLTPSAFPTLQKPEQKRIPNGTILTTLKLESCKAYPTQYYTERGLPIKIAYADQTKNEQNTLTIKYLPDGGKTAPHPQIVFFVNGTYHLIEILYQKSNPANWRTWIELHIDAKEFRRIINAVIKTETYLREPQQ